MSNQREGGRENGRSNHNSRLESRKGRTDDDWKRLAIGYDQGQKTRVRGYVASDIQFRKSENRYFQRTEIIKSAHDWGYTD